VTSAKARIGCAILAAGPCPPPDTAKQIGSLYGQPFIERVTIAACRSQVARTAVIVGSRADEIAAAVSNLPVDIISNPDWPAGLASSVRAAIGWARGRRTDGLLLAVVDPHALSTAHLDAIVAASDNALQIVASAFGDVLGFPALFPRDCYSRLEGLENAMDPGAILRAADPDFPIVAINLTRGASDVDIGRGPLLPASGYLELLPPLPS